jgi:hypothetical protein
MLDANSSLSVFCRRSPRPPCVYYMLPHLHVAQHSTHGPLSARRGDSTVGCISSQYCSCTPPMHRGNCERTQPRPQGNNTTRGENTCVRYPDMPHWLEQPAGQQPDWTRRCNNRVLIGQQDYFDVCRPGQRCVVLTECGLWGAALNCAQLRSVIIAAPGAQFRVKLAVVEAWGRKSNLCWDLPPHPYDVSRT